MKKIVLLLAVSMSIINMSAQTAVNFTCNDCSGNPHDLFSELDSGKVVVICWVMPCGACISGGLSCSNIVASYPSNVYFYLVDDVANTSCSSLASWASSNNIHPTATFSNAAISMSHYGATGMPKCVVIGGSSHTVFYNANNTFNVTAIQSAIDQALIVATVPEKGSAFIGMHAYPNPAQTYITVSFSMNAPKDIHIDLYNMQGEKFRSQSMPAIVGENKTEINVEGLAAGSYLVRITDGTNEKYSNVVITK